MGAALFFMGAERKIHSILRSLKILSPKFDLVSTYNVDSRHYPLAFAKAGKKGICHLQTFDLSLACLGIGTNSEAVKLDTRF